MSDLKNVSIDGKSLNLAQIIAVARHGAMVGIAPEAKERIDHSRKYVENLIAQNHIAYGVTTGYGPLVNRLIPPDKAEESQHNLIQMLSGGVGKPLRPEIARAIQLIRINSLCKGFSGIRLSTMQTMVDVLNADIAAYIPETGSVGASGDLCPLAHMVQAILGQGEVFYKGELTQASKALEMARIKPVKLSYKEGLALINGTTVMSGMFALALKDTYDLTLLAEGCAAFATDVLRGNPEHFDKRISKLRPHPGQMTTSENLLRLVEGSDLHIDGEKLRDMLLDARSKSNKVLRVEHDLQNPYSIRCVPQIIGAVRDLLTFTHQMLDVEVNSVTDNPLIFAEDDETLHGGNFYGQHISFGADILALGIAKLALLSERRFARYIDEKFNQGLPAFLVNSEETGLINGFMGVQMVTTALAAEIRALANTASIATIPTNANNQDVVSMGTPAAQKLAPMIEKTRYLFAYELMALAQAADILGVNKLSRAGKALHSEVRRVVKFLEKDRPMRPDIQAIAGLIENRRLIEPLEQMLKN